MKRIAIRSLVLLSPLLLLVSVFIVMDPLRVIRRYDSPLLTGPLINDRVFQRRWLEDKPFPYDGFIMGSSRSKAFLTDSWKPHVPVSHPFHMGVNDETLFGILHKLAYLDRKGYEMRSCLLVLDHRILSRTENPETHLFREDYRYSREAATQFYKYFFMAWLKPGFLKAYWQWKIRGAMDDHYMFAANFGYDRETGDHYYTMYEEQLRESEDAFYEKYRDVFYDRGDMKTYVPQKVITEKGRYHLTMIYLLLQKKKCPVKVVIAPWYDQVPLHPDDIALLEKTFGKKNVYDYSGVNPITENIRNYYEHKHFRPFVADSILNRIY